VADKLSNGLFISELRVDNAGSGAFDTDDDGGGNDSDDFVELQCNTNSSVSLDGIEIRTRKNVPALPCLTHREALGVFNSPENLFVDL